MATTIDTLAGRLELEQSKSGYRFGLDAVILATDLPRVSDSQARVVDLGAGHGAVCSLVALTHPDATIVALEREDSLFELLKSNIQRNQLSVQPIQGDVRNPSESLQPHWAHLVLSNPPFYRPGEGRQSPDPQRRSAHEELHGGLQDFVKAAAYVAQPRGRLKVVLPPARLEDLMQALQSTDFGFETLRFVHSKLESDAYLFEAVARRSARSGIKILPPLIVFESDGVYTQEMQTRLNP